MSELESKILAARPSLWSVAPVTFLICWGYVVINVIIGLGMIFLYSTPIPLAVANILPYPAWGILFLVAAIVGAYGLIRNDWGVARNTQLYGLLLKAVWAVALVIRSFIAPASILITAVWLFFVFVQAVIYIYFIPVVSHDLPR